MEGFIDVFIFIGIFAFFFLVLKFLVDGAIRNLNKPRAVIKEDDFLRDHGYTYDFCFVFQVYDEDDKINFTKLQQKFSMKVILFHLVQAGLQYTAFYSCQRDEVYVKIRIPPERVEKEADRINYKLRLNEERLKLKAQTGKPGKWNKITITDEYKQSPYEPWEYIYAEYRRDPDAQSLYVQYSMSHFNKKHPFREVDRVKLMISVMQAKTYEGGCGLYLSELLVNDCMLAAIPLHNYDSLEHLQRKWLKLYLWPWKQPIDEIKDYFGERIGLYFVYLGYYTTMLLGPAIFGIVVFFVQTLLGEEENFLMPVFATFMVLWSTFFLEGWKRLQVTTAMKWGVVGYEDEEQDRPQFNGILITSPVDGSQIQYFIESEKNYRRRMVTLTVCFAIFLVVVIVGATFAFQYIMVVNADTFTLFGFNAATVITPLLNAVVIAILNVLYSLIVYRLNDYENHQTDTEYEDALVAKIFVFQLVNSFAALTYVAFIKSFIGGSEFRCTNDSCTGDVAATLATVFLSRQVSQVILEVFVRKYTQAKKTEEETSGLEPGVDPTPIEYEYYLNEYDVLRGSMTDYAGLVIQYGYTVLFVAAFPLAPAMAYASDYLQIRIDAWKLCQAYRRPLPKSVEDIGTWQDMLDVLSTLAVIFNFGLIFYTGHYLEDVTWEFRWIIFIFCEHAAFVLKYALDVAIPDQPPEVEMQIERQKFLVDKVLFNVPDDDDDDLMQLADEQINILIDKTDRGYIMPSTEDDEAKDMYGKVNGEEDVL